MKLKNVPTVVIEKVLLQNQVAKLAT